MRSTALGSAEDLAEPGGAIMQACSIPCGEPGLRCQLWQFLPAFLSALAFCAASSGIILLNKYIVSVVGFRLPMTLSLLGMVFSFVASAAVTSLTPWVPRSVQLTLDFSMRRSFPVSGLRPSQLQRRTRTDRWPAPPRQIGLLIALTLYFGNLAYVTLSVSFLQMLKASTPILVMVLMFAARLETPSLPMVVSVLVIALGTLLAALGEVRVSTRLPACELRDPAPPRS